ncbi:hypothetical protein [Acidisphaera sp. L21]|uniref:hypothetical protein n=1 Tax=Acidisphaera sp. L21 TaxID=1641851 RepID=UPI00131DABE5|nr:hypothetical protein [Acidisphaera sp. L21]
MKLTAIIPICVVLLAGCAQAPEDVPAERLSSAPYQAWSCSRLVQEKASLDTQVAGASAKQEKAYIGDTLGVLSIGLPTASRGNQDDAAHLAHLKGQQNAVVTAAAHIGCPAPAA